MTMQTYPYTDLNECASNSTNTCHEDAECHDTEGSYWCECGPGFTGDGYNCTGTTVFLRFSHNKHNRRKETLQCGGTVVSAT